MIASADGGFVKEQGRADVVTAVETFWEANIGTTDTPVEDGLVLDPAHLFGVDAEAVHAGLDHFRVITLGKADHGVIRAVETSDAFAGATIAWNADPEIGAEFETEWGLRCGWGSVCR